MQQPASQPEPERRGWFLRKKPKEDLRVEPAPAPVHRATVPPRASAQVMTRSPSPAEPLRQAQTGDDLFPDHKRDEQFEIPAFLRRQSN
jgi:hypothetical protein